MRLFKKQLVVLTLNVLVGLALASTISNYTTSYFEGEANINERSKTFLYSGLTGTLPTSNAYAIVNAETTFCAFDISGVFQRGGTGGPPEKYAVGITNDAKTIGITTYTPNMTITKPSYIVEFTAIEILAYSAAVGNRQLRINGVDDDTNVTSAGTWDSPINIGKITFASGTTSITILSPDGNILIKSFTLYFI
jgi:hypothetical protein